MDLCLRELFVLRVMQTDPNWTNFLWNRRTRKVELVDFGATREYSKEFIDGWLRLLSAARNDLEPPARSLQPVIGEALAFLASAEGCRLARMSGSGATVLGLFDDSMAAGEAAKAIERAQPRWWVKATSLR